MAVASYSLLLSYIHGSIRFNLPIINTYRKCSELVAVEVDERSTGRTFLHCKALPYDFLNGCGYCNPSIPKQEHKTDVTICLLNMDK